jgi:hypothetical protein
MGRTPQFYPIWVAEAANFTVAAGTDPVAAKARFARFARFGTAARFRFSRRHSLGRRLDTAAVASGMALPWA